MRRFLTAVFLALGLASAAVPAAQALDALRRDLIAALDRGFSTYGTEPLHFTGVETTARGAAVRVEIADLALRCPISAAGSNSAIWPSPWPTPPPARVGTGPRATAATWCPR